MTSDLCYCPRTDSSGHWEGWSVWRGLLGISAELHFPILPIAFKMPMLRFWSQFSMWPYLLCWLWIFRNQTWLHLMPAQVSQLYSEHLPIASCIPSMPVSKASWGPSQVYSLPPISLLLWDCLFWPHAIRCGRQPAALRWENQNLLPSCPGCPHSSALVSLLPLEKWPSGSGLELLLVSWMGKRRNKMIWLSWGACSHPLKSL